MFKNSKQNHADVILKKYYWIENTIISQYKLTVLVV